MSLIVDIKKKLGDFSLDVSLETGGGVTGLLGASGSGKSVTLKCIAGVLTPDRGRIIFDGKTLFDSAKKINLPPQKRNVGYLFQHYALFPNMTVRQNIKCGMRNKPEKQEKLQEIIKTADLEGLESRRPEQLSGGQQQRVALARILVGEPKLLLLDEPFSAVDSYLREHLQTEMKKLLRDFNMDAIFVSHNRDEIYSLCGKTALLDRGKIIAHKDVKKLWREPETRVGAVLTGCKNIANARKMGEHEIEIPDWGVRFTTAEPVRDGLCAVGIRARYFGCKITENNFPITIIDKIERPFEYNIQFRFKNQNPESKPLCWLMPKEKAGNIPANTGVSTKDVMLLYEQL